MCMILRFLISLPNMSVVPTEAAMYSFPQVRWHMSHAFANGSLVSEACRSWRVGSLVLVRMPSVSASADTAAAPTRREHVLTAFIPCLNSTALLSPSAGAHAARRSGSC
jgi:hypothetical protein